LLWAQRQGGISNLTAKSQDNLKIVEEWVAETDWVDFLTAKKENRSSSTIVIKVTHPIILSFSEVYVRNRGVKILI
jgi:phosphoserine aminotransferase